MTVTRFVICFQRKIDIYYENSSPQNVCIRPNILDVLLLPLYNFMWRKKLCRRCGSWLFQSSSVVETIKLRSFIHFFSFHLFVMWLRTLSATRQAFVGYCIQESHCGVAVMIDRPIITWLDHPGVRFWWYWSVGECFCWWHVECTANPPVIGYQIMTSRWHALSCDVQKHNIASNYISHTHAH